MAYTQEFEIAPAEIVANVLTDGLGTSGTSYTYYIEDWPLFISFMPDAVDNCVAIYDTMGTKDARSSRDQIMVSPQGLQITVRGTDYETTRDLAQSIENYCAAILRNEILIDADYYKIQSLAQSTPIYPLGYEVGGKRRFIFTINFLGSIVKTFSEGQYGFGVYGAGAYGN